MTITHICCVCILISWLKFILVLLGSDVCFIQWMGIWQAITKINLCSWSCICLWVNIAKSYTLIQGQRGGDWRQTGKKDQRKGMRRGVRESTDKKRADKETEMKGQVKERARNREGWKVRRVQKVEGRAKEREGRSSGAAASPTVIELKHWGEKREQDEVEGSGGTLTHISCWTAADRALNHGAEAHFNTAALYTDRITLLWNQRSYAAAWVPDEKKKHSLSQSEHIAPRLASDCRTKTYTYCFANVLMLLFRSNGHNVSNLLSSRYL